MSVARVKRGLTQTAVKSLTERLLLAKARIDANGCKITREIASESDERVDRVDHLYATGEKLSSLLLTETLQPINSARFALHLAIFVALYCNTVQTMTYARYRSRKQSIETLAIRKLRTRCLSILRLTCTKFQA